MSRLRLQLCARVRECSVPLVHACAQSRIGYQALKTSMLVCETPRAKERGYSRHDSNSDALGQIWAPSSSVETAAWAALSSDRQSPDVDRLEPVHWECRHQGPSVAGLIELRADDHVKGSPDLEIAFEVEVILSKHLGVAMLGLP